jgi:hypothetical protein
LPQVPAMQRRRLGPLARIVFQVLHHCAEISEQEKTVFSSMMGEIHRTQSIIESIATDTPISPAAFSLAVHNSIAGLWSIIHGIHSPMTAISPMYGSPIPGLLEAASILNESNNSCVNLVFYEEDFPSFYSDYFESPSAPSAVAIRLTNNQASIDRCTRLSLTPSAHSIDDSKRADPLDLLPLLTRKAPELSLHTGQSDWHLRMRP